MFNFLCFTHICSGTWNWLFCVLRQTMTKRMRAKHKGIQGERKQRMHHPIPKQGKWLRIVTRGYYQYDEIPRNYAALRTFRYQIDDAVVETYAGTAQSTQQDLMGADEPPSQQVSTQASDL
jgi:RNA-directed DNA polymerase